MHSRKQPGYVTESACSIVDDAERSASGSNTADLWSGFQPAYRDIRTGETHLALASDGSLSGVHTFYGLPEAWVEQRDAQGNALALFPQIVAGFWRLSCFIEVGNEAALPSDA